MGKFIARVALAATTFILGVTYGLNTLVDTGYQAPSTMASASHTNPSAW